MQMLSSSLPLLGVKRPPRQPEEVVMSVYLEAKDLGLGSDSATSLGWMLDISKHQSPHLDSDGCISCVSGED